MVYSYNSLTLALFYAYQNPQVHLLFALTWNILSQIHRHPLKYIAYAALDLKLDVESARIQYIFFIFLCFSNCGTTLVQDSSFQYQTPVPSYHSVGTRFSTIGDSIPSVDTVRDSIPGGKSNMADYALVYTSFAYCEWFGLLHDEMGIQGFGLLLNLCSKNEEPEFLLTQLLLLHHTTMLWCLNPKINYTIAFNLCLLDVRAKTPFIFLIKASYLHG